MKPIIRYVILFLCLVIVSFFLTLSWLKRDVEVESSTSIKSVFSYRDYKGLRLDVGGIGSLLASIGAQSQSYFMTYIYIEGPQGKIFKREFHADGTIFFDTGLFSTKVTRSVEDYNISKKLTLSKQEFYRLFGLMVLLSAMVVVVIALVERAYRMKLKERLSLERSILAKKLAHDIRSPLTALQVAVSSLKNKKDESEKLIARSIERITEIADSFLLYSDHKDRPDGIGDSNEAVFDILSEVIDEKRAEFLEKDQLQIKLICTPGVESLKSNVPKVEISRIVSNLINNAVAAKCDKKVSVEISLSGNLKCLKIRILDDGPGVPDVIKEKIFDEGVSGFGGSGLGLFLARQTLRSYLGDIELVATTCDGTEFVIYLPLENRFFAKESE